MDNIDVGGNRSSQGKPTFSYRSISSLLDLPEMRQKKEGFYLHGILQGFFGGKGFISEHEK